MVEKCLSRGGAVEAETLGSEELRERFVGVAGATLVDANAESFSWARASDSVCSCSNVQATESV